jgi:hypothetical protein
MPEIALYDPRPLQVMEARRDAGRLWVAADDSDGWCRSSRLPSTPAAPAAGWAGRCWTTPRTGAAADGLTAPTLPPFAHVPWNAPYYVRRGFRVLDDAEITQGLQAVREREAAISVDRWPRVCMRRDL